MIKKDAGEEVIPSAKRLINSLRSLGYEFPTAVAELVDNSIEANATEIVIKVEFDGENSWVMIADNGMGMSSDTLKEAMRFGSARVYNENSLGKFGLGLKTASFSQCKNWLVASKTGSPENEIIAYQWDLDHVNRTDRWEILPIFNASLDSVIQDFFQNKTGTVVFWQRLDRILDYENPNSDRARKKMITMCRDLEEHLAMVFHRFIIGEVSREKLKIYLNDNEILPWDPYARNEKATKELEVIRIPLEHEGIHGEVVIEPYILPPSKLFSTPQAHSKAAGPKKWNQQQGFYIYRNDRMIQSGGWCRIRTYDEHNKLARFAINFSSKIDGAFKIDVSKMYVQLPQQIRKEIMDKTQPLVNRARDIYDNSEKQTKSVIYEILKSESLIHERIPDSGLSTFSPNNYEHSTTVNQIEVSSENFTGSSFSTEKKLLSHSDEEKKVVTDEKKWTLDEIFHELKKNATPTEISVLEGLFNRIKKKI